MRAAGLLRRCGGTELRRGTLSPVTSDSSQHRPGIEPPAHTLAEVLSCQPGAPSLSLALTFDSDQLFWFDFPRSSWTPRLPQLPPWPPGLETPEELLLDASLCQELLRAISKAVTGILPEAKGIPVATVFPMLPPALGQANTLVCLVENIFPPAVRLSWQLNGEPPARGVTHTHYTPTAEGAFVLFSYLEVTPGAGDIVSCLVSHGEDNSSVVAYWVPPVPAQSEVLETALCGAAMALGILLGILGISLLLVARRNGQG
ncbi:class II histocompatibility antigen, M alpha chain isoform X2 [Dryobates pubescens]|uniref:class II histocompatibility antigen, M alpha chain isoform X2 n=1 Tax=Dryobates pubescens TaxID=118200 RepID=UPI0023B99B31|nr:class II histocompatibility antigen, M alpha chain isoform X2 [Dryobates pubescens]